MIRRVTITAALLMTALFMTGCMQIEYNAVIGKDGSGTYSFQVSMSQEVEQALQELQELDTGDQNMEKMPDFTNMGRDELDKELAGHHCKLKSFRNEVVDGRRVIQAEVAFDDIEGFNAAAKELGEGDEAVGIFKNTEGNYVLTNYTPGQDEQESEEVEEETTPADQDIGQTMENAAQAMQIMGKLMSHANEMSVKMSITLPSDVISHSSGRVEGRTVIWELNSDDMMSMEGMSPNVVFDGKGLKLNAPALDQ